MDRPPLVISGYEPGHSPGTHVGENQRRIEIAHVVENQKESTGGRKVLLSGNVRSSQ
jgi:hypothetical protein